MGLFDGIKNAKSTGNGNYFADGKYLVEVQRFAKGVSQKGDGPYVVIEATILDVIVDKGESNKPGESVSQILMSKHAPFLGNVKNFLAAALEISPDDVDEDDAEKATAGDGSILKGTRLIADANTTKTKRGNDFTKVSWTPAPA